MTRLSGSRSHVVVSDPKQGSHLRDLGREGDIHGNDEVAGQDPLAAAKMDILGLGETDLDGG